jgi:hypothetical protein
MDYITWPTRNLIKVGVLQYPRDQWSGLRVLYLADEVVTEVLGVIVAAQPECRHDVGGTLELWKVVLGRIYGPVLLRCSEGTLKVVSKDH